MLPSASVEAQRVCPECGRVMQSAPLDWLAQQKANTAARLGIKNHVGGSLGGATAEGVGWASTPQRAIQRCCFSGHPLQSKRGPYKTRLGTAVARGNDGYWYACILVR